MSPHGVTVTLGRAHPSVAGNKTTNQFIQAATPELALSNPEVLCALTVSTDREHQWMGQVADPSQVPRPSSRVTRAVRPGTSPTCSSSRRRRTPAAAAAAPRRGRTLIFHICWFSCSSLLLGLQRGQTAQYRPESLTFLVGGVLWRGRKAGAVFCLGSGMIELQTY